MSKLLQYCGVYDVFVGCIPDDRILVVPGAVLREVISVDMLSSHKL